MEEIKHGHLFPELYESSQNENTVSRFLPIYAGILGAHFLTLAFHLLSGLSIVKVMLVLSDLAIAITFYGLFKVAKKAELSALGLVYLFATQGLLLLYQFEFGFYAQTLGIALGYLAIIQERQVLKTWIMFAAGICYPDIFLWTLPLLISQAWREEKKGWQLYAAVLTILFLGLLVVLLGRLRLSGTAEVDWISYSAIVFILFFVFRKLPRVSKFYIAAFTVITLALLLCSELKFGQLRYYARKPLYWSPIFLALVLPSFRWKRGIGLLLVPLTLLVAWDWESIELQAKRMISSAGVISSEQEIQVRNLIQDRNCREGLFLPSGPGFSETEFQILNAITGRSHAAKMILRPESLGPISTLSPDVGFEKSKSFPPPSAVWQGWNLYCPADLPMIGANFKIL